MEFLGIGPLELVFILILILLVVGPKDIERVARSVGNFLSRLQRSENYQLIQKASQELRNLPERLVREAQLDELKELEELKDEIRIAPLEDPFRGWKEELPSTPPNANPAASPAAEAPHPEPDNSAKEPMPGTPPDQPRP